MTAPTSTGRKEISSHALGWLLVILVMIAFGITLFGGLVFDDRFIIVGNEYLPSPSEWSRFFTESSWAGNGGDASNYRALPLLSFGLNYLVGGLRPFDYHLVNLVFHVGNVLLLFALGQRLGLSKYSAWLASALFAVHPLQTEPVAEIVGRMDLMAATGVLAALLCHLIARASESRRSRHLWFLSAVLCYASALWSKEHAILFPVAAAATDFLHQQKPRQRWLLPYLAYAAVGGLYLAIWFSIFEVSSLGPGTDQFLSNPLASAPGPLRFVSALGVTGLYLGHFIWPVNLSPDYCFSQIQPLESIASGRALLTLLGALVVVSIGVAVGRRSRVAGVGLVLGASMFLPVSNLLFPIGTVMGDRLFYLPIAGLALVIGALFETLDPGSLKQALTTAMLGILAMLVIASFTQSLAWRTNFTLDQQAVRAAPLCARGHSNLGYDLLDRGDVQAAEQSFLTAIGIYTPYPQAQAGIARVAYARQDWRTALTEARKVLAVEPKYSAMMHLAGNAALQEGEKDLADQLWRQALDLDPTDHLALTNLAVLAWSRGDHLEAVDLWSKAIENPESAAIALFNLAAAYDRLDQASDALRFYQSYLQKAELETENPASVSIARERVAALQDPTAQD